MINNLVELASCYRDNSTEQHIKHTGMAGKTVYATPIVNSQAVSLLISMIIVMKHREGMTITAQKPGFTLRRMTLNKSVGYIGDLPLQEKELGNE